MQRDNMKNKILRDPISVKKKVNGAYPFEFKGLTKDQAHSGFLTAGNDYGVGHRTPVGTEKCSGMASGPIPQQSKAFSPNEIFATEDRKG
jgi:hypothetical protein